MMLVALFKMAASLPMPIDKHDIQQEIGTKVYVSSKEELKKLMSIGFATIGRSTSQLH